LIEKLPQPLTEAAAEPYGARAVIYALLLAPEETVRAAQLASLRAGLDEPSYRQTCELAPWVDKLPPEARLPLADRAFPALKQLSAQQYAAFRDHVESLVKADGKMDLFEYTIQAMLLRVLDVHFGLSRPGRPRYYGLRGLLEPLATVLSTLAHAGHSKPEKVGQAFESGVRETGLSITLRPKDLCTLKSFDAALNELTKAAPKVKRQIVAACVACVAADGTVTVHEGELLRAITATLGCPMPPLLATPAQG